MTDAATIAEEWEAAGEHVEVGDHRIWCRRIRAATETGQPTLLVLHGFPTSSIDWCAVVGTLSGERDVVLVDVTGFGLADKPDRRYGIRLWADDVEAAAAHLRLDRIDLLTHDMGDTVGGELLARDLEGELGLAVERRVVTNGSIYMDLAQLTAGQELLLSLPDRREPMVDADDGASFRRGVHATYAPGAPEEDLVLDAATILGRREDGLAMLPRTIRYIEDRRAEEARFTGAIEAHPSPLGIVWGAEDPVAVVAMAERLAERVPSARSIVLDGVGHYPMLEAPERFAASVLELLEP